MDKSIDTKEAELVFQKIANTRNRPSSAKRVFIAIPNMNEICVGLVAKLFRYAMQREFNPWFYFETEKRHTDYARNLIVAAFQKSPCDYLYMIDADVDPAEDMLQLINRDKDIISGNVFCWIRGELMASIWQRSECEQCKCLGIWLREGKIHDPSQYKEHEGYLMRWNPFNNSYEKFADKEKILPNLKCRCKGTGLDPFVFKSHKGIKKAPLVVDSIGSAAMIVHKRVFKKMPFPWFRFLYRESGEILMTEDHYFCWKANECGMKIWADPSKVCHHYKMVDLLQLTALINKAYTTGRQHEKMAQSVEIPLEDK
jgi:hypothetical protein